MRRLGRLALAAAVLVPVGAFATAPAGAAAPGASCTGSTGAINSVLTNNGVGDHGGLLLARKGSQQFRLSASGQTCTGGFVTGARTKMKVTTATPVNCQNINTTTLGGSGTFTWTAPAGMGTSNFNVQWRWTSNTTIHFSGSVSASGSTNNLFNARHVNGNITTSTSLASTASGGNCSATIPLTSFAITAISYKLV